jgi:L-fucose mutarotase/ribose pyranase (RbsD/FucU family)
MQVVDQADQEIPIVRIASLERFAFYERTRGAFRVAATGEDQLYGNILLKKGIVRPVVFPPPASMVRGDRRIIAHCRNPVR